MKLWQNGNVDDCCTDFETVNRINQHLQEPLEELISRTFFTYYKVYICKIIYMCVCICVCVIWYVCVYIHIYVYNVLYHIYSLDVYMYVSWIYIQIRIYAKHA